MAPLVVELSPAIDAEQAFLRLVDRPHCLFLDSARRDPQLGRYSFLACDPFDFLELPLDSTDALARLAAVLAPYRSAPIAELPPFQGGAAGLFSYDLGRQLERLPAPRFDEFRLPALAVGLYDVVLAFDHVANRSWIVSQGFPETDPAARERRAADRACWLRELLAREPLDGAGKIAFPRARLPGDGLLTPAQLAPQFTVPGPPGLTSNFTPDGYLAAIERAIDYIHAGDVFQVNLAQRLLFPAHDDSVALYLRLRRRNPATFAGYFDLGGFQIASASPERFLRIVAGQVEARPIKGTRRRVSLPEVDLFSGDELRESEKDRAENIMIVDLLRNDLSRVCLPDSVHVAELCRLETYEFVQHLVSIVRGQLLPGVAPLDAFGRAFPGGSITGAPKVRAMEIIAELEPTARGAYCGALAYLGFDGTLDANLLIRTITAGAGWWQAPVGGGIIAQSRPPHEYAETWHKAEGLLRAFMP